jgi:hypothetical protein
VNQLGGAVRTASGQALRQHVKVNVKKNKNTRTFRWKNAINDLERNFVLKFGKKNKRINTCYVFRNYSLNYF